MSGQEHPMRTGESWEAFLRRYRLRDIRDDGRDGWVVESASGATYHVAAHMGVDRDSGSYTSRMTCDCPARKTCRHINAVMDMRHAEELAAAQDGDADGMDIIDRTQF
ncbi:MAG TPA: hypothetical protein VMZ50_02075 [Phycisphaerae bacterium]|nr:hypothetical protein [Phycisphaerae bacterium]